MIKIYNYKDRCPSVTDFETYLQGKGSDEFMLSFENHISECSLCNESIQGFEVVAVDKIDVLLQNVSQQFKANILKPKINILRVVSYAASIAVLVGVLSVLYVVRNQPIADYQPMNFDYSMLYCEQSSQNKKIKTKSTEQFIYINSCNKIAYNDQYLAPEKLINVLNKQENISLITVEVGISDYKCANRIISTIKNSQSVPVLTVRNVNIR